MLEVRAFPRSIAGVAYLALSLSPGCRRSPAESPPPGSGGTIGATLDDDVRGVAKQAAKTAKDIGHATADLADKAGQPLDQLSNQAGAASQDAWITTKVKSALTAQGLDPLHVHVDTTGKVVTLSGTVPTVAGRDKAVAAARTVTEAADVKDHLFVGSGAR